MWREDLMFLLICTYVKPIEEVDKSLAAHREYLHAKLATGELLVAGRRNPRVGGILITTHKTQEEARRFADEDPFSKDQVATFEVFEWTPTVKLDSAEKFLAGFN